MEDCLLVSKSLISHKTRNFLISLAWVPNFKRLTICRAPEVIIIHFDSMHERKDADRLGSSYSRGDFTEYSLLRMRLFIKVCQMFVRYCACAFSKIRAYRENEWVTSQKAGDNKFIVFSSAPFRVGLMTFLKCEHRETMLNIWPAMRHKNGGNVRIFLSKE